MCPFFFAVHKHLLKYGLKAKRLNVQKNAYPARVGKRNYNNHKLPFYSGLSGLELILL